LNSIPRNPTVRNVHHPHLATVPHGREFIGVIIPLIQSILIYLYNYIFRKRKWVSKMK